MSATLYTHQYDAIQRLKNGSILVGGVGSGKSRTSLGYFYKTYGGGFTPCTQSVAGEEKVVGYSLSNINFFEPKDLYIITTAMKRDSHEWEIDLSVYLLSTDPEKSKDHRKVIVDSWNNVAKYIKIQGAFFIFDEQRVGGTGKWAKSFIKIARANSWILLSATPGDTWSDYAPVFIANNFYKNFSHFRARHCVYNPYTTYPKIDRYMDVEVLESHRKDILVYMHYKRQAKVCHEYVHVKYDAEKYKIVTKNRWNPYKEAPCREMAELCSVWRRITNEDPSRVEAIKDIFEKHRKLIIFYNYDYELEILRNLAEEMAWTSHERNGKKHEEVPETDEWAYLVQYKAGAEAWNCIVTNCIVFYSQTYSYKESTQAAGRIDRMNTPFTELYYYHLLASSPIDLAISRCLKTKEDFNEKMFVQKEGGYFENSKKERSPDDQRRSC